MKKVRLPGPHRHAGIQYDAGDEIDLSDEQYEWFVEAMGKLRYNDRAELEKVIGTNEWVEATQARSVELKSMEASDLDGEASE